MWVLTRLQNAVEGFPYDIYALMCEVAAVAWRLMMRQVGENESGPKREIQTALPAQPGGCMSARRAGASAIVSTDTAGRACLPRPSGNQGPAPGSNSCLHARNRPAAQRSCQTPPAAWRSFGDQPPLPHRRFRHALRCRSCMHCARRWRHPHVWCKWLSSSRNAVETTSASARFPARFRHIGRDRQRRPSATCPLDSCQHKRTGRGIVP